MNLFCVKVYCQLYLEFVMYFEIYVINKPTHVHILLYLIIYEEKFKS
jgi:hypothetical protein